MIQDRIWKDCKDCSFYNQKERECKVIHWQDLPSFRCYLVNLMEILSMAIAQKKREE